MLIRQSQNMLRVMKENIYQTFVRPILEHGSMIYDICPAFVAGGASVV